MQPRLERRRRFAINVGVQKSASSDQYSTGTNASISRSRSTTIRERSGLHASRGKAALHFLPEQRADGIAHDSVQYPPRLLGIDEVHVDLARILHR